MRGLLGLALALVTGCGGRAGDSSAKDTLGAAGQSPGASLEGGTRSDSGSAAVPGASHATGRPRVLIVGTSLTAGYGLDDPNDSYPHVIQRLADSLGVPVTIAEAGVSGETSAGALRRIDWVLRDGAEVVVIETGANDGLRGLDVDTTEANLRAIVRQVRARLPGAVIAVAQMEAPPNLGAAYTAKFHDAFGRVARAEGATLIPFFLDGVAGVARLNQGDGIHPNPAGARIAASNMWRTIVAILPKSAP